MSDGGPVRPAWTTNLSQNGLSLLCVFPFEAGKRLSGHLMPQDGKAIPFLGDIRWSRRSRMKTLIEQHSIGLQFVGPPPAEYVELLRPPEPPPLATGLEGTIAANVAPSDLAAPPELGIASITPVAASTWIREASIRALDGKLPAGMHTVGRSIEVEVECTTPTRLGSRLLTIARLIEISGMQLHFQATVKEGTREVASGRHVRHIVDMRQGRR